AVFVGGFTLEAAAEVVSGSLTNESQILDILAGLVDKSLVLADVGRDGTTRYRQLETLRQYGRDHLDTSGETEKLLRKRADYFIKLCEQGERHLHRRPQKWRWFARLAAE